MSRIELAPEVGDDLERIIEHLIANDVTEVASRIEGIIEAIDVLASNPLIGRPSSADMRELVSGRDARGYVVLYRFIDELDMVLILAIRAQREAGYAGDDFG